MFGFEQFAGTWFAYAPVGVPPAPPTGRRAHLVVDEPETMELQEPTASDRISLGILTEAMPLTQVRSFVRGPGSSVTWSLKFGFDPNGPGELVAGPVTTLQSDGVKVTTALAQSSIPAGAVVWVETSAIGGAPVEMLVNVE